MRLRRQLGVSMLVQGVGAASVLLATLLLGASLGPEAQGAFNRTKAEIEFVAAFAMFGLPQALFFHLKSKRISADAALRWALGCAVFSVLIAACYALVHRPAVGVGAVALLAVAIGLVVTHGQLRALLLVQDRTTWFNAVTALPQVLLFMGVIVIVVSGSVHAAWAWAMLFAVAYGLGSLVAWLRVLSAPQVAAPLAASAGWRELARYGSAAWLSVVLTTAAILAVQGWVEGSQGAVALGRLTMAMTLVQVPLTPISFAAPLLFARWMEQPGARVSQRLAGALFAALLCAAALVALAAPWWPDLGLGSAYAGTTLALAVLLVGAAAEAASRVLTVHANAGGTPWLAVQSELARWFVLVCGGMLQPASLPWVCAVWAGGAWLAAGVLVLRLRAAPEQERP